MSSNRTILANGKYLRLIADDSWEYVERRKASGVVAVIAVTEDRRLLLTEQYRKAVDARVIDLPAGLAGDTADAPEEGLATAAERELLEETGYRAKRLEHLVRCPSSPGLTSEIVSYFRAVGVKKTHDGGGDESEQIDVHAIPLRQIKRWIQQQIDAGKLIDPKVYAALYFVSESPRTNQRRV